MVDKRTKSKAKGEADKPEADKHEDNRDLPRPAQPVEQGSLMQQVSAKVAGHIPPRSPDSGFKRAHKSPARTVGKTNFLPGQGLADPNLHPETPGVLVNQPYGSPPAILDPKTGTTRRRDPKPEDIALAKKDEAA